jgi:hypothetical protein
MRAFVSEFSIPSAMQQLAGLKRMAKSDDSNDRAMFERILKNAAIIHTIGAQRGLFKAAK